MQLTLKFKLTPNIPQALSHLKLNHEAMEELEEKLEKWIDLDLVTFVYNSEKDTLTIKKV